MDLTTLCSVAYSIISCLDNCWNSNNTAFIVACKWIKSIAVYRRHDNRTRVISDVRAFTHGCWLVQQTYTLLSPTVFFVAHLPRQEPVSCLFSVIHTLFNHSWPNVRVRLKGEGRDSVAEGHGINAAATSRQVVWCWWSCRPHTVPTGRRWSARDVERRAVSWTKQCPFSGHTVIPGHSRTSRTASHRQHAQLQ